MKHNLNLVIRGLTEKTEGTLIIRALRPLPLVSPPRHRVVLILLMPPISSVDVEFRAPIGAGDALFERRRRGISIDLISVFPE